MVLPVSYPGSPTGALANYDYYDIADGTGVKAFYGVGTVSGSVVKRSLCTDTSQASLSGGLVVCNGANINFQVLFNIPKTIRGTAIANIPLTAVAATGTRVAYVSGQLLKVSNGAETIIGDSVTSNSLSVGAAWTDGMGVISWEIPKTHFKKGDALKLAITGFASGGGGSTGDYIGYSPMGEDPSAVWSVYTPRLTLFVPFVIET